ncbi:MMPL family transporter [Nocardioides stalactiti]|uniref:MMPL family transporter n=1 Tax=Nocardioides stalactiti TaxID=2755356 RepID=UPI0016005EEF|nr:MMPL family transporter [Nocardioides stalactiti]
MPRPAPVITASVRAGLLLALLPLLVAALLIGAVGEGERDRLATDSMPRGYDSTAAAELAEDLPDDAGNVAIVVFAVESGRLDVDGLPRVGVAPPMLSEDGTAALAVVPIEAASATANADAVDDLRDRLAAEVPDGVTAQVTGPAGIEADLAAVFDGANLRLLTVTALVVAVLLILTYRSPVLWIIPLVVVGVADRLAAVLATQVLAALSAAGVEIAWDESTVGILSVLVFGAGTNYALLLMSRYRDELARHEDRREALGVALRRTAEPVLFSAATVVVGVLTLLLSVVPTTRGLGVAAAVGIVTAVFFGLVVLPAALSLFGRWVFWPRVPRAGEPVATVDASLWRRIGDQVARRPSQVVAGVLAVLVLGASGLLAVDLGLDRADQFLDKPEAIAAAERIAESFPAGTSDPTSVVTRSDEVATVVDTVRSVPGVVSVRPGSEGDGVTELQVVLEGGSGSAAARATVEDLRDALADVADTHVGGAEAEAVDEAAGAARDRWVVMPLILVLVLAALVLLLRAAVAAIVLVLAVVASYAAAMGASWWIFTGVLGFEGLDVGAPLLAFLFLVALGVDYSIFLVTRAREEATEHGTREGMLRALASTGGVITSAGILLAAVFAVLGVLPLVVLAQLGTIVCVGVLLDTLVVRTLLVPALAVLLGDRFWWPRQDGLRRVGRSG